MSDVSDLGRRVTERRRQLGLSENDVARRAYMHPAYLAMLESSSGQPTHAALLRLAAALERGGARCPGS
jgi:transcriptional regulator with XRE-family HTH domain